MEDPPMKIVGVLGAGSYGAVYLAHFEGYECEPFAMKSAPKGTEEARSLEKEMRVYRTLQGCPGITLCYMDTNYNDPRDGLVYYTLLLDFAPAGTLHDLIMRNQGRPFPEQTVAAYSRMILTGLHCMHSRGYVHCDLKPENILAFPPVLRGQQDELYQLKLADFGLAEEPDNRFPPSYWKGKFRGTPNYMSPESVRDGIISRALDIWSVGCIALQMLNGWDYSWSPFFRSVEDIMEFLLDRHFDPMEFIPASTSKAARLFLFKCLTRVPGYSRMSADDLLETDAFLAGLVAGDTTSVSVSRTNASSEGRRPPFSVYY